MGLPRRLVRCSWVLVLALSGCHHRRRPPHVYIIEEPRDYVAPRRVTQTSYPASTSSVESGVLAGVVVDEQTGTRLGGVDVAVTGAASSTRTDSSGRFRLTTPRGTEAVTLYRVGYSPAFLPLHANPDSGYATVVALTPAIISPCTIVLASGAAFPGVTLLVRDAVTGAGVSVPITVTLTSGLFRDSVTVRADTLGAIDRTLAPNRPGYYAIAVRAAGYHDWYGRSATRPVPYCGGEFSPAAFHAWLVPR